MPPQIDDVPVAERNVLTAGPSQRRVALAPLAIVMACMASWLVGGVGPVGAQDQMVPVKPAVRPARVVAIKAAVDKPDTKSDKPAEEVAVKTISTGGVADNSAEIRLLDGSLMMMKILEPTIEVATAFGKLSIPSNQTRRIEFGLRLPEAKTRAIEEAIAKFSAESFDERETATKALIEIGGDAYPALRQAAESEDPEMAQRAKAAMRKIREKAGATKIPTTLDDRIETALFSVVGRVTNATLKTRGYFGDNDLRVADLRAIRWMTAETVLEVTIDAEKYGDGNASNWLATNITLEAEMGVVITASGQVNLNPDGGGEFITGPTGNNQWGRRGNYPSGALLGKIGTNGTVFTVGEKHQIAESNGGKLFLQIAPSPWNRSQGSYKVRVRMGRNIVTTEE